MSLKIRSISFLQITRRIHILDDMNARVSLCTIEILKRIHFGARSQNNFVGYVAHTIRIRLHGNSHCDCRNWTRWPNFCFRLCFSNFLLGFGLGFGKTLRSASGSSSFWHLRISLSWSRDSFMQPGTFVSLSAASGRSKERANGRMPKFAFCSIRAHSFAVFQIISA